MKPGIVGKIGFNSSSVGVCLNAIRAKALSSTLLPIHLLLRIALQCTSVDKAIEEIERLGGSASAQHILIADLEKGGRALEVSPKGNVYYGTGEEEEGAPVPTPQPRIRSGGDGAGSGAGCAYRCWGASGGGRSEPLAPASGGLKEVTSPR